MANAIQNLQADIINILKADTAVLTTTNAADESQTTRIMDLKIVDGVPSNLLKGTGFPFIIVHTPEEDSSRLTMTKHRTEFIVHIEIIDRREGNVRILTDAVKYALQNAQTTTKGHGYWWYGRRVRSNLNYIFLQGEQGSKPVWHMNLFLTYLWTGS